MLFFFQDFSDPTFNRESPREFAEAQYQRVREVKIAIEELKVLYEQKGWEKKVFVFVFVFFFLKKKTVLV